MGCPVTRTLSAPCASLYLGDCLAVLRALPDGAARCCVTSPPYWGLRDYGVAGQLGIESTPAEYVARMVEVFAEVRRVLAEDGTLWLNLGDSYTSGGHTDGLGPKQLVGIPWRVAFALQADGWYLRSDIIWHKPNPMPESVRDRPTKAHEYMFLLSKRERYYYDQKAIREPHTSGENTAEGLAARRAIGDPNGKRGDTKSMNDGKDRTKPPSSPPGYVGHVDGRNARTVWTIATQPCPDAHFATFPEKLVRRCVLAGSAPGDTVLDPFGGSGTTAKVATDCGRIALYIDLNAEYLDMAERRIGPMICRRGTL